MLFLEMMKNPDHAPRAAKAAAACGLPVFLGISARTGAVKSSVCHCGSARSNSICVRRLVALLDLLLESPCSNGNSGCQRQQWLLSCS